MWNPLDPNDGNYTRTWMPEPTRRGSFSILSSCLITLALCVWTSLHLNVPEHKKQNQQLRRKAMWLFIGLVAPEWVAFTAYTQHRRAALLQKKMGQIFNQRKDPSKWRLLAKEIQRILSDFWVHTFGELSSGEDSSFRDELGWVDGLLEWRREPSPWAESLDWTIVHSHYVVMGGFAIDTSTLTENFLPGNRTRLTLTLQGFLYLLLRKPRLVDYVSKESIVDKSKASQFAKTIVCIQASWFMVQCITRMALRLPISLLELSTFVHALCALVVYGLWWNKPLDIEVPTIIRVEGTDAQELIAAMVMQSRVGSAKELRSEKHPWLRFFFRAIIEPDHEPGRRMRSFNDLEPLHVFGAEGHSEHLVPSLESTPDSPQDAQEVIQSDILLEFDKSFANFCFEEIRTRLGGFKVKTLFKLAQGRQLFVSVGALISPEDHRCMRLAWRCSDIMRGEFLTVRSSDMPDLKSMYYALFSDDDMSLRETMVRILPVVTGFMLSGLVYGGIHLFGWYGPFPTHTQKIIWRISVISIGAPALYIGALITLLSIFAIIFWTGSKLYHLFEAPTLKRIFSLLWDPVHSLLCNTISFGFWGFVSSVALWVGIVLLFILALALGLSVIAFFPLYAVSRMYIVVESFITLFYVPDGVFDVPVWSNYFPHIG